jgi:ABC-type amino acid transport substrate-binding protein
VGAELVGPDAEIGKAIIARIEELREDPVGTPVKLNWINRTYPTLIPAMANGDVHFALGVLAITDERSQMVQFSDPYYTSELVMAINPVHKDMEPANLSTAMIGVREGTGVEAFVTAQYPSATIEPFKTLDDAILALRRSEVDTVIDDKLMVGYSLATTPGTGHMEFHPEVLGTLDCGVAMKRRDSGALELVNGIISQLKESGQLAAWTEEHAGDNIAQVTARRDERLAKIQREQEPRKIQIRVSRDSNVDFDIYKMANLRFNITEATTGKRYQSTPVAFQGSTGTARTEVPPGTYTLSLPKFNFSTSVEILPNDPGQIPINIRVTSTGVVVRKG